MVYLRLVFYLLFCVGGFSFSRCIVIKVVGNMEDDLLLLLWDLKSCEYVDLILIGWLCIFLSLGNVSKF